MDKRLIWGGFGTLLLVGILGGYAPDVMLASEMRSARAEGLLSLPPRPLVSKADDARPLYSAASVAYSDAPIRLATDFANQIKRPDPNVAKYLRAMGAASARPGCSDFGLTDEDAHDPPATAFPNGWLGVAGKAIAFRATNEAELLPAARIERHLAAQAGVENQGHAANLVVWTLDRAAKLKLDEAARERLVKAFGALASPRETLRRHVARMALILEKETQEGGGRASQTKRQLSYVRFWRNFFRATPAEGQPFIQAVRQRETEIERAEGSSPERTDLSSLVAPGANPWTRWATRIDEANRRLESGR